MTSASFGTAAAGSTSMGGADPNADRLSVSTSTGDTPDVAGGKVRPETDVRDVSLGDLVGDILADVSSLMRKEIELAKAEIRQEATKAGKGVGMLGGATLAGYFTLLFASLTLMFVLDLIMPLSVAALIVTVLWGAGAAILAIVGRNKLREVNPVPEQTVESVKEDVQTVKGQR